MRISDWSSDVCSSDLQAVDRRVGDLAEILAEELRDMARLVRDDGERRVVAHRPDRFLRILDHRRQDQLHILHGQAGGDLTAEQFLTIAPGQARLRSEEHTSELQSLMRISYAVFCLKKKTTQHTTSQH